MGGSEPKQQEFDLFLSHGTPDKPWVRTLADELEKLGLRVFLDERELKAGQNWVVELSEALAASRYLVLVLSTTSVDRGWVIAEWTGYMAEHGPLGRLLRVQIDSVEVPTILKSKQAVDGKDRNAARVADELFKVVGDPSKLKADDARRLVLGRDLVFTLSRDDKEFSVIRPDGSTRTVPLPWQADASFGVAHLEFGKLQREALTEGTDRADLFRHARVLGSALFDTLFDAEDAKRFAKLLTLDRARPVVQIRSDDDLLLSLPWELLHHDDEFLLREGRIDLVRTTPTDIAGETLLKKPTTPFKLVVNVSAPEDSQLSYEAESYRITLATAGRCVMVPTELGTLEDLVETVDNEDPTGIQFSGHGMPGALLFEDDEGRDHLVEVGEVIKSLRQRLPDERRLPPFFYLASCHGNEPTAAGEEQAGTPSAAVQLHKAGVTEVVGYFGPIVDELSTRAEETIYEAIAEGRSTRDAVRLARETLTHPLYNPDARHRPSPTRSDTKAAVTEDAGTKDAPTDTHPFAWAQLVFYRRGPEWPLSVPVPAGKRQAVRVLQRRFEGFGDRKVLKAGFIGRRLEQHKIRRRIRQGDRVLVLQGLGGLGKSTLAQRVLPWMTDDAANVCTLWCQEVEGQQNRAEALVGQLLDYCRKRFGLEWEGVVQQVDQAAGDDAAKRFVLFLQTLVQNAPGLVLYLDNLESLLIGPEDESESGAFGQWAEPALETIWASADSMARDTQAFYLIASCRYRNDAFSSALLPVTPLPADALFRLTDWFAALQRLTIHTRARLVSRLDGHPRAVEYANDLVDDALTKWRDDHGEWAPSVPPKPEEVQQEWLELVNPCLPQVAEKLKDNLLLEALWQRVLDEPARRFLYRMTVLRQPAEWDLLELLGEPDEPADRALATAQRLRATSLLEQVELRVRVGEGQVGTITHYTLHPATEHFIREAHGDSPELRIQAHRRLGVYLEAAAKETHYVETMIEAGHHLFEVGEYDRANELLGPASEWLQGQGRVREGLRVLEPFLEESVRTQMDRSSIGRLLGTVGLSHYRLGKVRKAIEYYEQRLVIAREMGDRRGEGGTFGNLGNAYMTLGNVTMAMEYHEQRKVIACEIGDRLGEGHALGNLGLAYARLGDVKKAIANHKEALVIFHEIGDRQSEGNELGNLGGAYLRFGEIPTAIGYYDKQLVICRESGDARGEGHSLGNLGLAYVSLGEVEKGIGFHEEALAIAREIGDPQTEGNGLANLGLAYASLGEVQKATSLLQQAKAIGEQIGDPQIVQFCVRALEDL